MLQRLGLEPNRRWYHSLKTLHRSDLIVARAVAITPSGTGQERAVLSLVPSQRWSRFLGTIRKLALRHLLPLPRCKIDHRAFATIPAAILASDPHPEHAAAPSSHR